MNDQVTVPQMTEEQISKVRQLETMSLATLKQLEMVTSHVLHAGMYSRTIMMPAGCMLTSVVIKIDTLVIVVGDATWYLGEPVRLTGYNVVPAVRNRKQAVLAHDTTYITMLFPTQATTVEEAEVEFTDEVDLLASHKDPDNNVVYITGD